jgi:signal transduction histidine kinase
MRASTPVTPREERMALPIPSGRHWKDPALAGSLPLVVLVLALTLSGVLAYQAHDAARSHRAASEGALRDYGAFASWELGRRVDEAARRTLSRALTRGFSRTMGPDAGGVESSLGEFVRWTAPVLEMCGCPGAVHDLFYFTPDGGFATHAATLPAADREWIRHHLSTRPPPPAPRVSEVTILRGGRTLRRITSDVEPVSRVAIPGRPSKTLVFTAATDMEGTARGYYGFVLDPAAFTRAAIAGIMRGPPLLPPTLTRDAPNDEVLAIAVSSIAGEPIFARGTLDPTTMVVDTVRVEYGQIVVRVGVRPEIAHRLVIGGLPRSRLPLLAGVFILTLVLGVGALVQIRRQQELAQLRSGFVSGVSHELRTPLAQIRLFSDLLDSGRLREPQRARSVRIIRDEARRLSYLVENVLRFARHGRGADPLSPAPADVARVVGETVESFAPLAEARGVVLRVDAPEEAYAAADADALRQVVLNLLDNAVKYGPAGQCVRVAVRRHGAEVRITVDDEGPGIPAADRERVWNPYCRLRRDLEAATGGSGIGLAVVRDVATQHGGTTRVEEAPGGGARIVVSLPAIAAPAASPAAQGAA